MKLNTQTRWSDFHHLIECLSEPFNSCGFSFLKPDGKCLHVKTSLSQTTLGLMQSPMLIKNFFPLDEDTIYFHNEPSFGCLTYGGIQFIFLQSGFLFCVQEKFDFLWNTESKGKPTDPLKIPPFPLIEKGKINDFIFESFKANPNLKSDFSEQLKSTLKKIQLFKQNFSHLTTKYPQFFTDEFTQKYLDYCLDEARFKIRQKVLSQSGYECELTTKETFRVKLATDESGVKIDFQGTSAPQKIGFSDLFTDGVCFHFLSHCYQFSHKMNSATFSLFKIIKPQHSLVAAKQLSPLVLAENYGVPILKTALHSCLWNIYGKNQTAPHNYFQPIMQFQKESTDFLNMKINNGRSFYFMNNYQQDRGYYLKNNSDGHDFPGMNEFSNFGIEVVSCEEFNSSDVNALSQQPPSNAWKLVLKSSQNLKFILFPEIIAKILTKDKNLSERTHMVIELIPNPKNMNYSPANFTNGTPITSEMNELKTE
ncbi:MAG: hydantoinase B/oxoprolinase family protein, partial [Bdellovibrionaceae bacterium]|nr:hydantoinase B/oxoprolinase family protein [Pseudobdellovibrionaceae bacterium]